MFVGERLVMFSMNVLSLITAAGISHVAASKKRKLGTVTEIEDELKKDWTRRAM